MVYGFLTNLVKTRVLGEVGDETVHLPEHLDVLDHLLAIGFQSTVEVMQVLDTTDLAGSGIEEFGGKRLRQRVTLPTVLLVAADKVVTVLLDHLIEFGNLIR